MNAHPSHADLTLIQLNIEYSPRSSYLASLNTQHTKREMELLYALIIEEG